MPKVPAPVNTNVTAHVTAALVSAPNLDAAVAANIANSAHIQFMLHKGNATPDSIRAAKGL